MVDEAIKWIGIVLLAGFIGYFGKHAAKVLIAKCSKGKDDKESSSLKDVDAKYKYKLEKKKLKALKKQK